MAALFAVAAAAVVVLRVVECFVELINFVECVTTLAHPIER